MKLSSYLLETLASHGARHVFFVPGGAAMHLNDSLGRSPTLAYTANLHEQASAVAAEAWAKVTNDIGVCMTTAGPGATNAVTGVAAAWLDSSPVIFISGQVKRADLKGDTGLRMLGVQEVDIVSIVRSLTKYAVTITEPESIRFHVEKALHLAREARRGPVWIDIPLDVQAAEIDPATLEACRAPPCPPRTTITMLKRGVEDVLALLDCSERPVIIAGNGIRLAGATHEFEQVVEALQVPVGDLARPGPRFTLSPAVRRAPGRRCSPRCELHASKLGPRNLNRRPP